MRVFFLKKILYVDSKFDVSRFKFIMKYCSDLARQCREGKSYRIKILTPLKDQKQPL